MTKQADHQCPALARIRKQRLATRIANEVGLSRSAVSMWRRVPADHVVKVSKYLRIARHRIRPDLYPTR
jgi:hypothetical protein